MEINGVALKTGLAFSYKDARRATGLILNVHRNDEVTFTAEKNVAVRTFEHTYSNPVKNFKPEVIDHSLVKRVSFTEFEAFFKNFVESDLERRVREYREENERMERVAEINSLHVEALRMNVLVDVARGMNIVEASGKLSLLVEKEKTVSLSETTPEEYAEHRRMSLIGYHSNGELYYGRDQYGRSEYDEYDDRNRKQVWIR